MTETHPQSDSHAGASAQREYTRRHQARRQRIRARYGPVGSLIAALAREPHNVDAWRQGGEGKPQRPAHSTSACTAPTLL
jgi:hypothetical protein